VKAKISLRRLNARNLALIAAIESTAGKIVLDFAVDDDAVDGNCNSTSQEADRIRG
jgi:hypothetical protein